MLLAELILIGHCFLFEEIFEVFALVGHMYEKQMGFMIVGGGVWVCIF